MTDPSRTEHADGQRLPPKASAPARTVDLRAAIRTYWRHKWVIGFSVILCVVLAALDLSQRTPLYLSTASLILNTRESRVVDVEAILSGLPADETAILGEIEIIRSSELVGRVVDKLRLDRDPEFNGSLREPRWSDGLFSIGTYTAWLTGGGQAAQSAAPPPSDEEMAEMVRDGIIAAVQGHMVVEPVSYSLVIEVSFWSEDPRKAALIANTIVEQYLVDQLEAKFEATARASSWLNERLAGLKAEVEASEAAVEQYKSSLSAGTSQSIELIAQQMTELNTELTIAGAARAEAQARYDEVASQIAREGSAAADVVNSPLVQSLRQQLADQRREEAQLAITYGDLHPLMIDIRTQIQDTVRAIEGEVNSVVANLRAELQVARSREAALQQRLNELEQRSSTQNVAGIELRQLEREAEASRTVYENFLSRFTETQQQEGLQQPDARMISKAKPPGSPASPNKKRTIMIAVIAGLLLASGIIYLLEKLDNAYRSSEQVMRDLDLPTLGMIPVVRPGRRRRQVLEQVLAKPAAALAEAIRSLRTSLLLSKVDEPPRVILLTSSIPQEGKSTTALLLAHVLTKLGRKVVLVDCDLRRPTLHTTLGVDNAVSMVDFLSHNATLDEIIHHDEATGVNLVPASTNAANAIDLLSSHRFESMMEELRGRYDIVILDTAPTLAVSDALVVGAHADAILYMTRWNATPREAVRTGVRALRDAGLHVTGMVFCQVDLRRHAYYGYGDHGSYYGKYKNYYTN